jgi:hypothetical protein
LGVVVLRETPNHFKSREGKVMKPMTWHPEPNDQKVNKYLDQTNHEPWLVIVAGALMIACSFTVLILLGTF